MKRNIKRASKRFVIFMLIALGLLSYIEFMKELNLANSNIAPLFYINQNISYNNTTNLKEEVIDLNVTLKNSISNDNLFNISTDILNIEEVLESNESQKNFILFVTPFNISNNDTLNLKEDISKSNKTYENTIDFHHNNSNNETSNLFREISKSYEVIGNSSTEFTCNLPDFDPFDPSVLQYLENVSAIDCGHPQYPLTFMDIQGYLQVNLTAVQEAGLNVSHLRCEYMEVIRVKEDENKFKLGKPKELRAENKSKIEHDFIIVKCHDQLRDNNSLVYETGHPVLRPLTSEQDERSKRAREEGALNVVIMALDSMSRLNFIRQLPNTYNFLLEQMNAVVLKGLNKNGENTLPNIMALLAGQVSSSRGVEPDAIGPFFQLKDDTYFDDVPFLWKNYSARGHVTVFTEDCPGMSIFNYLLHGFKTPPTDYYMRPLWLAMQTLKNLPSKDGRCFGHLPKHELLWSYTEKLIQMFHDNKNAFFTFSFATDLSHSSLNNVQVVDDDLAAMLKRLKTAGSLDHTVFILMGDHGNRINSIRKTVIGCVEDRMPFFSISLPDELQHFRENVEKNARVLTSWHDVYETLMDIATDNLQPESRVVRHGYHGSSLLREISSNRTCRDVGVPDEYCVCNVERKMSADSAHAHTAAHAVVDYINLQLVKEELMSLCAEHVFDHVIHAESFTKQIISKDGNSKDIFIRVALNTKPANASFEAMLHVKENEFQVSGDVNRINQYGNQSYCMNKKLFQKFCYCKSLL